MNIIICQKFRSGASVQTVTSTVILRRSQSWGVHTALYTWLYTSAPGSNFWASTTQLSILLVASTFRSLLARV